MSRSKLSLVAAFGSFLGALGSADAAFVHRAGPVLLALLKKNKPEQVRAEWRRLNVAAYAALKLRKGQPGYSLVAKRSSQVLSIGLRDAKALKSLVNKGQYLQRVYAEVSGKRTKKAASAKPLSFRARLVRFLRSATSAQRKMVQSSIRSILAEAVAK